jgi:hemoglobin
MSRAATLPGMTIMRKTLLAAVLFALAGCAGSMQHNSPPPRDALYRELGGTDGISAVVDTFLGKINADARINTLFATVDHKDLRRLVIEQLCEATGGPCKYTGRTMQESHSGLNLTDADFNAFVEDLRSSMDQLKVPRTSQQKLIALLAPMKPQVVGQ